MKHNLAVRNSSSDFPFSSRNLFVRAWIMLLILVSTSIPRSSMALDQPRVLSAGTRFSLALVGYNYTSRYIDTFSVNGQGGGNLYVSGPTSGGGGTVCCMSYVKGRPAGEVTVRWQSGGCMFRVPGGLTDGSTHLAHSFFREIRVKVDPRIPDHPQDFEVHFYPDGRVEAAITDGSSSPRLIYNKSREDRSEFPMCPDEKEPKR